MVKHTHGKNYLKNPHELVPVVTIHPEVQHPPPPEAEHYLLPAVFTQRKTDKLTAKYPGNGVYYIIEGELEYEDDKNPGHINKLSAGSVLHVEEGETVHWYCQSETKGFAVFWVPVSVKSFDVFIISE